MTRRPTRPLAVLAVALAVAVVVAACGGSSSPPSSTAAANAGSGATPAAGATGADAASARRAQLAACLKKYGVTLPARRFVGPRFGASGPGGPFRRFGATGRVFGATGAGGVPGAGFGAVGGGGGFLGGNPKAAAAFAKCGGLAGSFGAGGGFAGRFGATGATGARGFPNPATNSAYRAAIIRYAACMKTYGVDLPAPNFSGVGFVFGSNVDRTTAVFVAANAKCQGVLSAAASGG